MSPLIKEGGYTWEKARDSMRYTRTRYGFLILRQLLATLVFDFAIMYLQVPAMLWYKGTEIASDFGFCDADASSAKSASLTHDVNNSGMHILIGTGCCIVYKALEILFYTPWSLYETFYIEVVYGFSKADAGSFIVERAIMLI